MVYQERTYRNYVKADNLIKFEVIEKETDLLILAESNLYDKALEQVLKYRKEIEDYIQAHPHFGKTFSPCRANYGAPLMIKEMCAASRRSKVGPMAAIAGALAEFVGKALLPLSREIIVENGGDIFIKTDEPRRVAVFAGTSPFSEKIALELEPRKDPYCVCTSSGTVGHSFSFGKADAVVVISKNGALADAAATAIGNVVKEVSDIEQGIRLAKKIKRLDGVLIIKGDQMGVRGKIRIVPL